MKRNICKFLLCICLMFALLCPSVLAVNSTVTLAADREIEATIVIDTNTTYDLNGKTLSLAANASGSVFHVTNNATLTISDSAGGGKITGGKALSGSPYETNEYGYNRGEYRDSTGGCGGGVYVESGAKLVMTGGAITGNRAEQGGGVFLEPDAALTVSGSAAVIGNYSGVTGSTADNVWLPLETKITIAATLNSAAKIGVTTAADVERRDVSITEGLSGKGASGNFASDEGFSVTNAGGEAALNKTKLNPDSGGSHSGEGGGTSTSGSTPAGSSTSSNETATNGDGSSVTTSGEGGGTSTSGSAPAGAPTSSNETATNSDGSSVTTALETSSNTKKNNDGSVTVTDTVKETVTTTGADGSKVEVKTEKTNAETTDSKKNADGSVTDTTKVNNTEMETYITTNQDGSKSVAEVKTEQNSNTAVTTTTNADGGKTETTETTETVKVTATTTDAGGKVKTTVTQSTTESKTDMTTAADGTATGTSTSTTTVKDDKGKVLSTAVTEAEIKATTDKAGMTTTETAATTTITDAEGNKTVEKTVTTENKTPDGSTGTIVKDEAGNILSQETTISRQEAEAARDEGRPAQSPLTVTPVPKAMVDTARTVQVNMPAVLYDKDGNGVVTVAEMPKVEIQVTYTGPGVVAKEKDANGNLIRIAECREGSVIVPITGTGEIVIVDNTRTFNDVGATAWYSKYVTFVTAREIFNGTSPKYFSPDAAMNRAMLAKVLYNFARGAKAGNGTVFSDVGASDWYNAAIGWAYENGIVNGYGGSFGAKNNITRQDMATILYRYAKQAGYDVSASASLDKFSDADSVADYAKDAMRWAVGMGLIGGTQKGTRTVVLDPTGNATRAQVAAVMTRFVRNAK